SGAPSCDRAPLRPARLTRKLRENRCAYPREFVARPPARVAIAGLKSIAPPELRVPSQTICRRDNRKAYRDSLVATGKSVTPDAFTRNGEVQLGTTLNFLGK